jgi:medium-chain acyl-[acyl-carrier-protein] hydrolase
VSTPAATTMQRDESLDGPVFRCARHVAFSEVDGEFRLRLPAMLRRFQDAAALHSERVGLGIRHLREAGRCWVLNRLMIERVGDADYDELLAVSTWSRGRTGLRMRRDFELTVGDRLVARGSSLWFLMDIARRRPVALSDDVQQAYGEGTRDATARPLAAWQPPPVPAEAPAVVFAPRDGDHDAGQHVNNCVYAEWLLDACRRRHVDAHRVADLHLAFERAIAPDATAASIAIVVHGEERIAGQVTVDGLACARAELRLRVRDTSHGAAAEDVVRDR